MSTPVTGARAWVPSPWPFLVPYLIPLTVPAGQALVDAGLPPGAFLTLAVVFGVIPLLDPLLGRDTRNPAEADFDALSRRWSFRLIAYAWVPSQLALLAWALHRAATADLSPAAWWGLALSVGVTTGGGGITVAHELCHRRSPVERALGDVLMVTVAYGHWAREHVFGHHLNVATPLDPATARRGESFWAFWPRTVAGTFRCAWAIESARLGRSGRGPLSPANHVLHMLAAEVLLATAVGLGLGPSALAMWGVQALIALSLLELVNYVEHYGLERRVRPDGKYERVNPLHSWNGSERLTNLFLVNLQRHSDHHAAPMRRYPTLRHFDESPQLPTGYAGMLMLALVPPLWRRVMDPLVDRARQAREGT